MSYGDDLMLQMLIDEYQPPDEVQRQEARSRRCRLYGALGAKTWIMIDGTTIRIARMDTSHIRNCITMLQRNMPWYKPDIQRVATRYIALFQEELELRKKGK